MNNLKTISPTNISIKCLLVLIPQLNPVINLHIYKIYGSQFFFHSKCLFPFYFLRTLGNTQKHTHIKNEIIIKIEPHQIKHKNIIYSSSVSSIMDFIVPPGRT